MFQVSRGSLPQQYHQHQRQPQQEYLSPLQPQIILLRDGETVATMYPIPAVPSLLPSGLLEFLLDEFNMEIEKGESFPYYEVLTMDEFKEVWFHRDGHLCIMVLGEIPELDYSMSDDGFEGSMYKDSKRSSSSSSSSRGRNTSKKGARRNGVDKGKDYQEVGDYNDDHANKKDKSKDKSGGKVNATNDNDVDGCSGAGGTPDTDIGAENSDSPGELLSNGIRSTRNTKMYKRRKALRNLNLNIHWEKQCLGIFELQPLFPGRSSHVVTGLFLVNAGIRGKGIGRTLVETFINWSKRLGFTSCCFPLLYETNVGMRQILEGLNFRKVGKLLEAGILKGFDMPIDSYIYSKELTHIKRGIDLLMDPEKTQEIAKYERLRHYLETGQYPSNCDRNEKARLRVTAKTHSLVNGKLMSRGKEIVYDPNRQRQIVLDIHLVEHQGINKVTAKINERYHWKGIKNTVTSIIANCTRCKVRYADEDGIIVKQGEGATKVQANSVPIDVTSFANQNTSNVRSSYKIGNGQLDSQYIKRRRVGVDMVDGINGMFKEVSEKQGDIAIAMSKIGQVAGGGATATTTTTTGLEVNPIHVAPTGSATTIATTGSSNTGCSTTAAPADSNILSAAMLSLEDNVMAALDIVQREQQQQRQQQLQLQSDTQPISNILPDGLHEYDQFLLNFNFDEEYHEDEDEDYQEDDDEEEEEEDDDDDDAEEYEDDENESDEEPGDREDETVASHYNNNNLNQPQEVNSVLNSQLSYQGAPGAIHEFLSEGTLNNNNHSSNSNNREQQPSTRIRPSENTVDATGGAPSAITLRHINGYDPSELTRSLPKVKGREDQQD